MVDDRASIDDLGLGRHSYLPCRWFRSFINSKQRFEPATSEMPRVALADGNFLRFAGSAPGQCSRRLVGGFGAFVAGSNTVSNMMFSLFQFGVGERIGVDPSWIVALQAVGGAAGNMICVHNVVAASAVVGLLGREGTVIRMTFLPFVYYALLPGSLGYLIVWHADKGWLNAGTVLVAASRRPISSR